jgi:hypothetical protein
MLTQGGGGPRDQHRFGGVNPVHRSGCVPSMGDVDDAPGSLRIDHRLALPSSRRWTAVKLVSIIDPHSLSNKSMSASG